MSLYNGHPGSCCPISIAIHIAVDRQVAGCDCQLFARIPAAVASSCHRMCARHAGSSSPDRQPELRLPAGATGQCQAITKARAAQLWPLRVAGDSTIRRSAQGDKVHEMGDPAG